MVSSLYAELGETLFSRRTAVNRLKNRFVTVVLVNQARSISGRIVDTGDNKYFRLRSLVRTHDIRYKDLVSMRLMCPREEDAREVREAYPEITQGTINETTKWARRGYRC